MMSLELDGDDELFKLERKINVIAMREFRTDSEKDWQVPGRNSLSGFRGNFMTVSMTQFRPEKPADKRPDQEKLIQLMSVNSTKLQDQRVIIKEYWCRSYLAMNDYPREKMITNGEVK
jgi:hypothetical protein